MTSRFQPSYDPSWIGWILFVFVIIFLVLGLWGCLLLYRNSAHPLRNPLIVLWTIGPPMYFIFNYHVLFRFFGNNTEHYLHSQSLYTNLWAGIGALLILILTGKLSKKKDEN